jgi:hypothetical protein
MTSERIKQKQETLEEAIDRIAKEDGYDIEGGKVADFVDGMVKGAKWQSERSYSEEEVVKLLKEAAEYGYENSEDNEGQLTLKWFESNLKKK